MKNNKLTIEELKVDSFATQISEKEMVGIKGGSSGYFASSQQCITDIAKLGTGQITASESIFATSNYGISAFHYDGDGQGNYIITPNDRCVFSVNGGGYGYAQSLGHNC